MARDKLHFPSKPDEAKRDQFYGGTSRPERIRDGVDAPPDPFPETPSAITLEDIAAEFGPEATIRGNTNLGVYEVVTPKGFYAIDRDKAAKLKSKAELRAYVDELKAHGKA